ncbi:MAG TPA: tyrosine--tRNA ligase [Candidatus Bathyarchaeia archaeon]|nr:tyrosine--tRNA ligase [Candidatus Bathyarchaeia archaeon]
MLRKATGLDQLPGMMHIGTGLVCGSKIKDMVQAGFHFIIFLADWHSMINNKYGGDMEKIETAGEYFKHCFTALGLDEDKVEYVWASKLASNPNYWERVIRVAKTTTAQRVMRALPIMGRDLKTQEVEAATLFYPCMQAADIFEMSLDVACAGIDQRKAHVLAREAGEKLRWGKPVALHTPMLMGLDGLQGSDRGSYDEDPKLSSVIAAKMSKSKPENTIMLHDSPGVIEEKLRKAYCPPKIVEGNPVIEYYRLLAFPRYKTVTLARDQKFGGDLKFATYKELEEAYKTGKIHPQDLKANMARILAEILSGVREYFGKHPEPLEQMKRLEAR